MVQRVLAALAGLLASSGKPPVGMGSPLAVAPGPRPQRVGDDRPPHKGRARKAGQSSPSPYGRGLGSQHALDGRSTEYRLTQIGKASKRLASGQHTDAGRGADALRNIRQARAATCGSWASRLTTWRGCLPSGRGPRCWRSHARTTGTAMAVIGINHPILIRRQRQPQARPPPVPPARRTPAAGPHQLMARMSGTCNSASPAGAAVEGERMAAIRRRMRQQARGRRSPESQYRWRQLKALKGKRHAVPTP